MDKVALSVVVYTLSPERSNWVVQQRTFIKCERVGSPKQPNQFDTSVPLPRREIFGPNEDHYGGFVRKQR